ncbi:MAG: hypothetical protein A2284_08060 [Deltaproteobacteria bacterium RIFOXYA12_FULL_61_11]|nr:MAG: hypothetical protein A2284_08060 [Deltaproteobacteria bacterium RIFOXYA12_FULL_61_11]
MNGEDRTEKINVETFYLSDQQVRTLDRIVSGVKKTTGFGLTRTHVVRALVDRLEGREFDFQVHSQKELERMLGD